MFFTSSTDPLASCTIVGLPVLVLSESRSNGCSVRKVLINTVVYEKVVLQSTGSKYRNLKTSNREIISYS